MGLWTIRVPEVGTNYVLNPSAEATGNFAAHNGATVAQSTIYARLGVYSYSVVLGAVNRGINLTLSALANAIHNVTFYVRGTITGTLQVSLNAGANYNAASIIGGSNGAWVRYGIEISAAQANGSTACIIRDTAADGTIYIDAVQVEQTSGYYTSYIDGDLVGGFTGAYFWSGLRHGSTSLRRLQERGGGRDVDIATYGANVLQWPGAGLPEVTNNIQELALQPGAFFQNTKVLPRQMTLLVDMHSATLAGLHGIRKDIIDVIKPDLTRGNQAFILGYTGALSTKPVYCAFRYAGGAEQIEIAGSGMWTEGNARVPIRVLAVDPFWAEDSQEVAALDFQDSIAAAAYGLRRINGQWQALGTGFNGLVATIAIDKQRGRVYFGGQFTTANGVTVNRICYWNGTTFVAMDSGAGNATVNTIRVAPNGDVWIGGSFLNVGSGAAVCKGLARWNVSAGTWTAFNPATTLFTAVLAIEIDSANGNVYVGGDFTNWDGLANADYIAMWNGSAWSALGTGMNGAVYEIELSSSSIIYVCGLFTTGNGVTLNRIGYWNGTTFVAMGGGADALVASMALDAAQNLYIAGSFTVTPVAGRVAKWDGATWVGLGVGVNNDAYRIETDRITGSVYLSGIFTQAGGLNIADRIAVWNGSTWIHLDVDLPGTPIVYAILPDEQNKLYLGYTTTGTALVAGITYITNSGATLAYPIITLIGPTSGSCILQWLENHSSGHRLYFNLTIQAGETVTIDLTTGKKTVTSDWRGLIAGGDLSGSDFATFHLLPGANAILSFITGTITGVTLQMRWSNQHWSVDGVAA